MQVGLLTEPQKDSIIGIQFTLDSYFNPVFSGDGNWVISLEEMDFCDNPDFLWVKDLPKIDFVPPVVEDEGEIF